MPEKAILIGLITPQLTQDQVDEYLEELSFLAKTAGVNPVKRFTQILLNPDNTTFLGKGKINEVKEYVKDEKIDVVIFDDDLTPSQLKNIQKIFLKTKILDRSNLILDIFASRAQTAQARTQVELAQYEYLLPRLTRQWTHLERQMGGVGTRAGMGETQIEIDRRLIREKISKLKKLGAYKHFGFWQCVDTIRDKEILEQAIKSKIYK